MATTAGTTARGLPYPGDTGTAPDGPAAFKALADAVEAMMNSPLVLGSSVTATGDVIATGGALNAAASVGGWLVLSHTSAGAGLKRSLLKSLSGATSLQSIPDAATTTTKVGWSMDHATGAVNFPNGMTGPRADSPYSRAYLSASVSYATGATVVFDGEIDPNGWYDNATGVFLPTVAGMYRISWTVTLGAFLGTNKQFWTMLRDNSAAIRGYGTMNYQVVAGGQGLTSTGTAYVAMNGSTDALHVWIGHDNGGSIALERSTGATHFEAERIGA